ncbi:MAG: PAS domain S-box protein [Myxococcales bacterium]|nr:PAS domain S-box protein [Myxococcales bacterium]
MSRAVHASTMTVHGKLKDLADASLERLVDVAVALADASFGVLALLDESGTQWSAAVGGERVQRLLPLCSFALLQSGPFVVTDLGTDPRFAEAVAGTDLTTVVGVRLQDERGLARGALCTFSRRRREPVLDDRERKSLAVLSLHTMSLVGMGQTMDSLRDKHREQLALLDNLQGVLRAADRLAIVATDREGVIRSFSVGAERLFGLRAADVVGLRPFTTLLAPDEVRGHADVVAFLSSFERKEGVREEWTAETSAGRAVPVSMAIEPVLDEERVRTGWVALLQDVTERRIADELKSEFVNTVSHELRTPLTSILGALALLRVQAGDALPEKATELLDISQRNGERLLRLVNDILDLSKMESRHARLEKETVDLRELLGRVVESDRPFAARTGVQIVLRGSLGAPLLVHVDPDRIAQVVTNLLTNATKFSSSGSEVVVELGVTNGRARVSVHDRGPGIAESVRPRLFQKFVQADRSDRRVSGTGLGLSIVKTIVELHGGAVGFDSELASGSTFWFDLPLG